MTRSQYRFEGTESVLHAAASEATGGLTDFGPRETYTPGLEQVLQALDHNSPHFTQQGYEFTRNSIIGILVARLLAEQGWKQYPQCLEQAIKRPVIIIGLPRTGTTALHKLLAMDSQFQGLDRWLTAFPMPRPPRDSWPENPWYKACEAGLEAYFYVVPEMRAAHNMRADDVDECLEVLKQDFCSYYFGAMFRVPGYDRWWLQQSEASSYRRLKKVMQLIGTHDPRKTWLLKNPGHVAHVDLLLDTFPDACIIQTHRNPAKALPSLCSVLRQTRKISETDVNPKEIGQRELAFWSTALDRADNARKRAPRQFLDIHQSDLHRHPIAVIERIYDYFGLNLSGEAEEAMTQRIGRNPESSHGEHRYTAEEFGLSEPVIRERFAAYMQRHDMN